jgi:hypothetical protein
MKTIIEKNTGKVLFGTIIEINLLDNQMAVDEELLEYFENPYYNFETKTFYNKIEI